VKLELESTDKLFMQSGLPARMWRGTMDGQAVFVLITAIVPAGIPPQPSLDPDLKHVRDVVARAKLAKRRKIKINCFCRHGLGGTLCQECHP
jgi:hypothetical protein